MALYLGASSPSKVYVGNTAAQKIYLGTTQIWSPPSALMIANSFYAGTSSVTFSADIGDLVVLFVYGGNSISAPSAPSPTTTTPAWNIRDNPTGANANAMTVAWYKADRNDHTSGVWGAATNIIAVVIKGQHATTPLGGYAQAGSTAAGSATAPATTLTRTDGTSLVLHALGHRSGLNFTTWNAPPAGYTQRAQGVTGNGLSLITKDVTTSAGAVTQTMDGTANNGYRGATLEILAA